VEVGVMPNNAGEDLGNSRLQKLKREYASSINQHFALNEIISENYKVACKGGYFSMPIDRIVELCKLDLALATSLLTYWTLKDRELGLKGDPLLPKYPSFARLANIYEKSGHYQDAIRVCERAIRLGYTKDGTACDMCGRLDRLKNKQVTLYKETATENEDDMKH
jgi:hypothetical protein